MSKRGTVPREKRRALGHVGGPVRVAVGEGSVRDALEAALDVTPDDDATRAHVHGFHSFAARLHPLTARRLIEALSERSATVLDPFAGSGTVLVEARLLGRAAIGTDLNPLAVLIARLKTRGTTARERSALVGAAAEVAAHAGERRRKKAGPSKRYSDKDRALFDVHVLLEIDGLTQGISFLEPGFAPDALELVLSSILVKVSRKPGDTADAAIPRRLAGGFTIRLFQKKTEELSQRLEEFERLLPPRPRPCRVEVDDARRLDTVRNGSATLVVTSPPYPGVYDYAKQHDLRLRFLGLPTEEFERGEIGSRRRLASLSPRAALTTWEGDLGRTLTAVRRTLAPKGLAVMVLADSVAGGRPLHADDIIRRVAPRVGMNVVAMASQERPHFHAESRRAFASSPRREHVFVLSP
jgi:16S rRNA G966 N2-methylase RsmD